MPTYYITTLNFAIPFFITLIAIEIFFSKVYNKDYVIRSMDTLSSLCSGLTNIVKDVLGLTIIKRLNKSYGYLLDTNKLDKLIQNLEQPVLGICLGMQLMCNSSEEGPTQCLKIFPNDVVRFKNNDLVPHMGWNNFESADTKLLKGVKISDDLYYVHSYYVEVGESTTAICNYQINFSSIIENKNFFGTQFHPEKSSLIGEKVLKNFLLL